MFDISKRKFKDEFHTHKYKKMTILWVTFLGIFLMGLFAPAFLTTK